jgi:glucose-6-phosphate isomerase
VNWHDGSLQGEHISQSHKTFGQIAGLFQDQDAARRMDANTIVYTVQWVSPAAHEGALLWGNTTLEPGRVADEYFMTHGHFHQRRDRSEFYATISGEGALLLMDEARKTWFEPMTAGSLHYIAGNLAHRVANVGNIPLRLVACWHADAGHDYSEIAKNGFSARLLCRDGIPALVGEARE